MMQCLTQMIHQLHQQITQRIHQFTKISRDFLKKNLLLLILIVTTSHLALPKTLDEWYYIIYFFMDVTLVLCTMYLTGNIELVLLLTISAVVNLLNLEGYLQRNSTFYGSYVTTMEWLYLGCITSLVVDIFRKKNV